MEQAFARVEKQRRVSPCCFAVSTTPLYFWQGYFPPFRGKQQGRTGKLVCLREIRRAMGTQAQHPALGPCFRHVENTKEAGTVLIKTATTSFSNPDTTHTAKTGKLDTSPKKTKHGPQHLHEHSLKYQVGRLSSSKKGEDTCGELICMHGGTKGALH
ncbi:hypothetical protein ACN28E_18400 [Archangium lansingense]|uniref:hypothetical protein n=1 Tax=Archangium lansingense TaxID=2995310 RepID=UPI003B7FAE8A